jgi:hypothetical protein
LGSRNLRSLGFKLGTPYTICRGSQEKEDVSGPQRISVAGVKYTKTQGGQKLSKISKLNKKESEMKL